ncbi:hypothetical protein [Gordonia oryzae]|uniref:hypothetical protein n=1 Tax=Gordonia oryzae TaxID=2487349 RepID=UPI001FEB2D03|nr:hypothetical protein [Gordonia oryzae]
MRRTALAGACGLAAHDCSHLLGSAAIVLVSAGGIGEGRAVLIVLGTSLITSIAHVLADLPAWSNIRQARESSGGNRAADDEGADVSAAEA